MSLNAYDLKCEHLINPIGIDCFNPSLSWKIKSKKRNTMQQAYRVCIAESMDALESKKDLVWDSNIIDSDRSLHIIYEGQTLKSKTIYFWSKTVWDNYRRSNESEISTFETAFLYQTDWKAQWLEPRQEPAFEEPVLTIEEFMHYPPVAPEEINMKPAQFVRRKFIVEEKNT